MPNLLEVRLKPRERSHPIWDHMVSSELLTKRQKEVVEVLCNYEDATGRELNDYLISDSAHKRLSELRDLGVVYSKGRRKCGITGKTATAWAITGNMPIPIVEDKSVEPTLSEFRDCIQPMRRSYLFLVAAKDPDSDKFKKLLQWVESIFNAPQSIPSPPQEQKPKPPDFVHEPVVIEDQKP